MRVRVWCDWAKGLGSRAKSLAAWQEDGRCWELLSTSRCRTIWHTWHTGVWAMFFDVWTGYALLALVELTRTEMAPHHAGSCGMVKSDMQSLKRQENKAASLPGAVLRCVHGGSIRQLTRSLGSIGI